jgi:hypothetical protein
MIVPKMSERRSATQQSEQADSDSIAGAMRIAILGSGLVQIETSEDDT